MIRVVFDGAGKTFGTHEVLKNVTCSLDGGRIVAVTGPNGSGKSTFLRLAGHLLRPSTGKVTVKDGETSLTREALRRELGMLSPEFALSPELTGEENLAFFLGLRGINGSAEERAALFARVGLRLEDAKKRTKACSTGQRQRLALAVLLASNAKLWLLDEPGANLDAAGKAVVQQEARKAADSGALVLVATNDENEAAWADAVFELGRKSTCNPCPPPRGGADRVSGGGCVRGNSQAKETTSTGVLRKKTACELSGPSGHTPPAASRPSPLWEGGLRYRAALHLLRRECTSALRARSTLAVMALFAVTALLALSMALGGAVLAPPLLSALLWVVLFFAASMGLGGAFSGDEASGTLLALRIYGASEAVLYGKTAFSFLMLLLLSIVLVPLFFVFLDATCAILLLFFATLTLGLFGLAAAGTLLAALTIGADGRQAGGLLPVLLLPVILPVFLPAILLTSAALGGRAAGLSMLVGIGLYDLLLLLGASLLFDHLWYED